MIASLAYYQFLGYPLIMYAGVLTLLSLLCTASISIMNKNGIHVIPFRYHPRMALLTIALALLHAILGLSIYFQY